MDEQVERKVGETDPVETLHQYRELVRLQIQALGNDLGVDLTLDIRIRRLGHLLPFGLAHRAMEQADRMLVRRGTYTSGAPYTSHMF